MPIPMTCSHCEYFYKEYYYDTDYEEYWLWECLKDHPEADEDQEPCEDFEPSEIANKLYIRGVLIMALEQWIVESEPKYRYMLLDRMRQDCAYYLGNGGRNPKNLWAEDEKGQIEAMKELWDSFPDEDKPEWLTWEEIDIYAQKMGVE